MLKNVGFSPSESVSQPVDVLVDLLLCDSELILSVSHYPDPKVFDCLGALDLTYGLYGFTCQYLTLLFVETEVPLVL